MQQTYDIVMKFWSRNIFIPGAIGALGPSAADLSCSPDVKRSFRRCKSSLSASLTSTDSTKKILSSWPGLSRPCRYSQLLSIGMADPEEEGMLGSMMPSFVGQAWKDWGARVGYMNSVHLVFASSSQETRPARSTATFRLELASPTVLHARTDSLVSCSFSSRIFGAVTPGTPFTLLLGTRRTPHEQSVLILVCKLLATVRRIEMRWW